ncbi:hypothetical protein LZ24_00646 [Desulfobotulus alkaliphilus]|uniref:Uncharacterized protein n=1 Tax=Desulfobotulus alkaliphilus TaxID=622671 RepID=A0A562S337_9BACT|nr:DUF6880 family protein [Desulfobotulus alkaliphilus]TWI75598.1 hypothetical protein LZ24_00646 [Desulfobotulus alkaliphilus]
MKNVHHDSGKKGAPPLSGLNMKTLALFLEDLADRDARIRERVEALYLSSDASALSAHLKKRLDGFYGLPETLGFRDLMPLARDFRAFLSDTKILMAPLEAGVALDLVDRFLDLDSLLEGLEENGGPLQPVFSEACDLWLALAAQSGLAMDWGEKILKHFLKDRFGVRVNLMRHADRLLGPEQLTRLADQMLKDAGEKAMDAGGEWQRYRLSMGLRYLSQALRNPDLMAQSVTLVQTDPSPRQIGDIVQAYLDYEGPEAALSWLAGDWGERELERLDLLDQVYAAMDDAEMLFQIRRERYAAQPSADYLLALLEVCDADEREGFLASAPETARYTSSLYSGLNLLLAIGSVREAEALLVERLEALTAYDYTAVLRIQEKFESAGAVLGRILCYRTLIEGILDEARFRAYGKAVAYCRILEDLEVAAVYHGGLPGHSSYMDLLRQRYGDKQVFWQRLDGRDESPEADEIIPDAHDFDNEADLSGHDGVGDGMDFSKPGTDPVAKKTEASFWGAGKSVHGDFGEKVSRETYGKNIRKKVPRGTTGGGKVPKVPRGTSGGVLG